MRIHQPHDPSTNLFRGIEFESFKASDLAQIPTPKKRMAGVMVGAHVVLEKSKEQTEQLQAQEEEMRQSMEELEATTEEFRRRETEYQKKIKDLESKLKKEPI